MTKIGENWNPIDYKKGLNWINLIKVETTLIFKMEFLLLWT